MGLVKEPHSVDFLVIDNPWTEEEKSEFSALIKLKKIKKGRSLKRDTASLLHAVKSVKAISGTKLKKEKSSPVQ
jgi:hypothetical protein